jgi:hypothetical protein
MVDYTGRQTDADGYHRFAWGRIAIASTKSLRDLSARRPIPEGTRVMAEHVIWKFPIAIVDMQRVSMPDMARFLTVAVQDGKPVMWAIVNRKNPLVSVPIFCFGTGNPMAPQHPANLNYLGTVQIKEYVWHFFSEIA